MGADNKSKPPPKPVPPVRITKIVDLDAPRSSRGGLARRLPSRVGMESLAATRRSAPVRVLLRPESRGALGASYNGDAVIPVGPASAETWGELWRPGDQEALVWVLAARVNEVIAEMRQDARIVDVRVSMRDVK